MRENSSKQTMNVLTFRSSETHKGALRADRKIKELQFTQEEEQKNFERMSDLVEKLQNKTRTYKKQIEDAEEIAALNLAKFRKAQQQLEEVGDGGCAGYKLFNIQAEDRSNTAENQIGRLRASSQVASVLQNSNDLIIKISSSPATTASTTDSEEPRWRRRKKNCLFVNPTNPYNPRRVREYD